VGLVVVSALFVLVGVGLLLSPGDRPLGALVVAFFGGCLLVGISRRRGDRSAGVRLLATGGLLMGVGCGVMAATLLAGELTTSRVPEPVLVAVAVVGLVFFGGGSVLLWVRSLSRADSSRT